MPEHIPPVFRSALDEPAPPTPPETEPDDDGGDDGHMPVRVVQPLLIVFSDGAVASAGRGGTLLLLWTAAASLATATMLWREAWWWIGGGWLIGWRDGLVLGALTVVVALIVVFGTVAAIYQPTRGRRIAPVAAVMAATFFLSVLIVRAWLP